MGISSMGDGSPGTACALVSKGTLLADSMACQTRVTHFLCQGNSTSLDHTVTVIHTVKPVFKAT